MDVKTAKQRLLKMKREVADLSEAAKNNRKPVALDQQSVGTCCGLTPPSNALKPMTTDIVSPVMKRLGRDDWN